MKLQKYAMERKRALKQKEIANNIFSKDLNDEFLPKINIKVTKNALLSGIELSQILKDCKIYNSKGEVKRIIKGGGVKLNDKKIIDEYYIVKQDSLKKDKDNYWAKLALGKKKLFKIIIQII